jgi:dienelactone hydrolase
MSVTYQCEQCGQWLTVREGKVGSRAKCDVCGHAMVVPRAPDPFGDAGDGPLGGAAPPQWQTRAATATATAPKPAAGTASEESSGRFWGGGLGLLGFILFLVLRVALQGGMGRPRRPRAGMPPPRIVVQQRQQRVDLDAPVELPRSFPDLGVPRQVAPGVVLHEVELEDDGPPAVPGHSGRLWLYLPATKGPRAPRSLPCVLMAPAGSSCLTGMKLGPRDRAEHLSYARSGFAVLAFELDGADPGGHEPGVPTSSALAFLRARGGLVNGEVAQAFLRAKVPAVDPGRLYAAGTGSAGAFALLFAEHEPGLKGCLAYDPIVDLATWVDAARQDRLKMFGLGDLVARLSPRVDEEKLACPVFLYHARGDRDVPAAATQAFADRIRSLGKDVTLELADGTGRADAIVRDGIPRGVAWLKARDAAVVAGRK